MASSSAKASSRINRSFCFISLFDDLATGRSDHHTMFRRRPSPINP
jgi:hypothetical protein